VDMRHHAPGLLCMDLLGLPARPTTRPVDSQNYLWRAQRQKISGHAPRLSQAARGADRILNGVNHGPFGEKNFIIPNGHWPYGLSRARTYLTSALHFGHRGRSYAGRGGATVRLGADHAIDPLDGDHVAGGPGATARV
jgi:hypothetical protein